MTACSECWPLRVRACVLLLRRSDIRRNGGILKDWEKVPIQCSEGLGRFRGLWALPGRFEETLWALPRIPPKQPRARGRRSRLAGSGSRGGPGEEPIPKSVVLEEPHIIEGIFPGCFSFDLLLMMILFVSEMAAYVPEMHDCCDDTWGRPGRKCNSEEGSWHRRTDKNSCIREGSASLWALRVQGTPNCTVPTPKTQPTECINAFRPKRE